MIAVGGDRISYTPGDRTLTLNGKPLEEPYVLRGDPVAGTPAAFSVTVPQGQLFLLGDNRGNSADSRYRFQNTQGGTIPDTDVKGVAIDKGHPVLITLRSMMFVGIAVLAAGAVCGIVGQRRRPTTISAVYGPPPGT
ncbi:signal peptidase I [Streptomyces sp. NBC_01565]|uniref:signal peptidase I n=1 Tax=Streptomyces sp. NBC_01565 TaxID=2975881 RepID=UPI0022505C2B|nr:signal peptidase I [Streptomyces sp. NBC_01565]MCX4546688.1 signal peptidase I [Streptomyces sp. NBC_01565]